MDIIKQFRLSAFVAAAINLFAATAMLRFLSPGLVPLEVEERISYIVAPENPVFQERLYKI